MCDISRRCWKEGHLSGKKFGEAADAELGWKRSHGHGDPAGTRRISLWKGRSSITHVFPKQSPPES